MQRPLPAPTPSWGLTPEATALTILTFPETPTKRMSLYSSLPGYRRCQVPARIILPGLEVKGEC